MKETAFRTLLGTHANRRNTTVEDIKIQAESSIDSPGLTDEERDDIRRNTELAIEYMRETKTMYLAYSEVTVYGVSFVDGDDANENANEWFAENGDPTCVLDVIEIDVPADAEYDDFISCAQVKDYEDVAKEMIENIEK